MSMLAGLQGADYPLYRVDVVLSTGQQFSYVMVLNSGLPGNTDDLIATVLAQALKTANWSAAPGMPPNTTATSILITRTTEQTAQRSV
jgi:hypothetical protein